MSIEPTQNGQASNGTRERFAMIPEPVMRSRAWADATGRAKAVLVALWLHANQAQTCFPSLDVLAFYAGVSRSSVKRALGELADAGLIKREIGGGRGRASTYSLTVKTGADLRPFPETNGRNAEPFSTGSEGAKGAHSCTETGAILRQKGRKGGPPTSSWNNKGNSKSHDAGSGSSSRFHDDELRQRLELELPDSAGSEQIIRALKERGVHGGRIAKRVNLPELTPDLVRGVLYRFEVEGHAGRVQKPGAYIGDMLDQAIEQARDEQKQQRAEAAEQERDIHAQAYEAIDAMPDDDLAGHIERAEVAPGTTPEHARKYPVLRSAVAKAIVRAWRAPPPGTERARERANGEIVENLEFET